MSATTAIATTTTNSLELGRAALGRVIAGWLLGYSSPNTRAAYGRDVAAFLSFCELVELDPFEAKRSHIDAYARSLEAEGLAAATEARRLASLASFYSYAEDDELITRNPVAKVRRPKVSDMSTTFGPDGSQVTAMIETAAKSSLCDLTVILLLALNGLRVSEAISLNAEHIEYDVRGHCVATITGKGGRVDRMPLPPLTCGALKAAGVDSGPILTDDDGNRLNRFQVARIVARIAKAAGIDAKVSPHSLRHSAVTTALDAGVSLRDVQDMARHADPRTTRRYDQGRNSLDRHAAYAIAAHVAPMESLEVLQ